MLGIGFKVSDAPPASLQRPLRDFLSRGFADTSSSAVPSSAGETSSSSEPSHLDRALDQFAQLKRDADLVRAPSAMARRVLLRYYAQLDRMAMRFDGASTNDLAIPFTWNDSFCPRKRTTAGAAPLRFEMAAVLFNYGALESQLGVQADRTSADGLKAACRHFMLAAGAFATVRDELTPAFLVAAAPAPDMSNEGLTMLTSLMLAQAQACFYEKAIKDKIKDAIKAKLVHQALEYYAAALEACESPALAGVIDRMWGIHVRFQVVCMRAATQYWQAKASKEVALARGVGYGEEIARLEAAVTECSDAQRLAAQNKLPPALLESARSLRHVVEETLQAAKKDNASIYLENIPKLSELPVVGKASMVRAQPLTPDELTAELSYGGSGDLFESFVPQALLQRAARAKDDVRALLETARTRVATSNDSTKQKLHAMGLPAAIEAFEHTADDGIPPGIWLKIQHVQQHDRSQFPRSVVQTMQTQLSANDAASERAEKQLHAVESRLSAEEIEDNVCRQNYGAARWPRPASAALNDGFRADIDRYYRLVKEAKESDKVVATKLTTNDALLELLGVAKPQLDAQLPKLQHDTSSCRDEITAVSSLLLQLTALMDEKNQVLHDFGASHDKLNVLPILLRSPATSSATASADGAAAVDHALADETQFFETHFVAKLDAICSDEAATLDALSTANAQFEAKKASDHALLARQAFLQKLSDAVDTYEQLQSHLKEGAKFYEELSTRIGQLQQTVDDHCAARDLERRELELHVQADDAQRQREAHDASVAAQMMRDMHLRDDAMTAAARDEAFARQLAGGVPQLFPPAPTGSTAAQASSSPATASGMYASFPSTQQQQQQQQPPLHHPYTAYQQQSQPYASNSATNSQAPPPPAYNSIFSSSPSSTPQFGNYYYAQQQQQPPPQQQQQPSQGYGANTSYHQYPGAAYNPNGPPPPPNGPSLFPRPPGGSV